MIDTLLFDLINTLIRLPFRPIDVLNNQLGFSNPNEFQKFIHSICLNSPKLTPEKFFQKIIENLGIDKDKSFHQEICKIWQECENKAVYIDGSLETLETLRKSKYKLVIVSNTTPPTWNIIKRMRLEALFDAIILSCDVGVLKPDSKIFRIALESVDATPSNACMIGDKLITDINGALNFGLKAILINSQITKLNYVQNSYNFITSISSIKDVPQIINSINNQ